jgi:hypothetical protein
MRNITMTAAFCSYNPQPNGRRWYTRTYLKVTLSAYTNSQPYKCHPRRYQTNNSMNSTWALCLDLQVNLT